MYGAVPNRDRRWQSVNGCAKHVQHPAQHRFAYRYFDPGAASRNAYAQTQPTHRAKRYTAHNAIAD